MYYQMYFEQDNANVEKVEIGYKILMSLSYKIFGNHFYLFFALCSALTIIPIYCFIKKKSKYPCESLFYFVTLGFYVMTFNMVRQAIAIALALWALKFLFDRKCLKYIATIIIASLFHMTALIMIPIYWIARIKFSTKKLIILMIILAFAGTLFNPIFNYITSIIPQYNMYSNYSGTDVGIGTYIINIIYLVLIFLVILNNKRICEAEKDYNIIVNIVTFSTFFIIASLRGALFARLIYYWFIPIVMILPELIRSIKKTERNSLQTLVILAFSAFYIMHIYSFNGVFPYTSIFS